MIGGRWSATSALRRGLVAAAALCALAAPRTLAAPVAAAPFSEDRAPGPHHRTGPPSAYPDSLLVLCDPAILDVSDSRPADSLAVRFPGLARALAPAGWSEAGVAGTLDAIRAAWNPASDRDRHLLALVTHRWLQGMPGWMDPARARALEERLAFLGARWHAGHELETEELLYCGSVLTGLASAPEADEWTGRAVLELLDQGWRTDCTVDFGAGVGALASELYLPVIRRGDELLRTHGWSPLARAIRLRVALAHETAWSVRLFAPGESWTGPGAEAHRRAALRGYERLLRETRDPAFRAELRRRIGSLRAGRDTGCRAYWAED